MKIDVAALEARLKSGQFTAADLAQGEELRKGLADGTLTKADLLLPGEVAEVQKALDVEAEPAPTDVEAEAADTDAAEVETPEPDSLKKALDADPESRRALNAVPALQALVKSFESLVESTQEANRRHAEDQSLLKSLAVKVARMESESEALRKSLAVQATAVEVDATRKKVGEDTADALLKALQTAGFMELKEKVDQLDTAVNHRPYTGNPPRQGADVRKSLDSAAQLARFGKADAMQVIRKSLELGKIREEDAERAYCSLDQVRGARQNGSEITFADIVQKVCGQDALAEYAG